jgi:glycosyltransferase involved in cell wall biosynthesis
MKILFIPHVPITKIINRVYEFSKCSESYFLSWEIENSSFKDKVISQIVSLFKKIALKENIITIPLLFKPENIAITVNTKMLNYAIKKFNIDVVVNANALLFNIEKIIVPVVYDLVDDHLTPNADIGLTEKRIEKIKKDIQHSQGAVCVTEVLEKKVKSLNSNTITIENGVYIEKFQAARSLKKELELEGKKVYGYIGGVEEWTGIDKACEAYMTIKNSDNAMIIVGGSQGVFFQKLKHKYKNDILFIGMVSPLEVGNYFKTLDVGLIPFKLNDFTNNAYPIKALEYGLAGAVVISTPLQVLLQKELPFISFYEIEYFSQAMQEIELRKTDMDFSMLSWDKQTEKLINFIHKVTDVS